MATIAPNVSINTVLGSGDAAVQQRLGPLLFDDGRAKVHESGARLSHQQHRIVGHYAVHSAHAQCFCVWVTGGLVNSA